MVIKFTGASALVVPRLFATGDVLELELVVDVVVEVVEVDEVVEIAEIVEVIEVVDFVEVV